MQHNDTIAAIATPIGKGGISVIRISGDESFGIIKKIFKGRSSSGKFISHHIYHGKIVSSHKVVDDVLISVFISPRSYTGEDVIEVSCHGGVFVTQKVLEAILAAGARLAEPGEFTKRAFINGKIDLTEAESVIDLIESKTQRSQQAAINRIEGKLFKSISKIIREISSLRSELELDIDFSEQGIKKDSTDTISKQIQVLKQKISDLVNTGNEGIILNSGYRIIIAGEPNAGKSSLFNKMIEDERSIVTNIPGTTRDYIEEDIALDGYLLKIFDTAGLSDSDDEVETAGVDRSYRLIEKSHLILWVEDVLLQNTDPIPRIVKNRDHIVIENKVDLLGNSSKLNEKCQDCVSVSSLTGFGIQELKMMIIDRIDIGKIDTGYGIISNTRQLAAARKSLESIERALFAAKQEAGLEFIAFDLREASESLEEIIGKITSDEIINSIFERFCVGK